MQVPMQRRGIFGRNPMLPKTPDNGMGGNVGTGEGLPDVFSLPAPQQGPTFKQRLGNFLEGTVNDLMHLRGIQNTAIDQRRAMEMYKQQQADTLAQYEAQQRIKAQYDKPTPNDTERDYNFILQQAGKNAADQWLKNRYDPIVTVDEVQNGATVRSFRPRSELTGDVLGNVSQPAPQQEMAPSPEEFERFVSALNPAMQVKAREAYRTGQMGRIPMGSPVGAPAPRTRPQFVTRPAPVKEAPKPRTAKLKIGDVFGGKEYIGGNPKSPSSWRNK